MTQEKLAAQSYVNSFLAFLKKGFPWLIAIAIFYYIFSKYPFSKIIEATRSLHIIYFILFSIIYFLFNWVIDCWSITHIFARFGVKSQFFEVSRARMASYLIMVVNYGAAQAIMAFFFKKAKQISLLKSTSLVMFISIIDLYWALTLGCMGTFLVSPIIRGIDISAGIRGFWLIATLLLILAVLFYRIPTPWRFLQKLKEFDLLYSFQQLRLKDFAVAMLCRLPIHVAVNTTLYFVALTYGTHISLKSVITKLPIVVVAGAVPITPGGLGTMQIMTVELFKNDVSTSWTSATSVTASELLVSMSLMLVFANYCLKALSGSLFFRTALLPQKSK